jgi:hypothetical protein
MIDGRYLLRQAFLQLLPDDTAVPFTLTDLFAEWLGGYTEIIAGPGGRPIGFMTHGEGPQFTERVRIALEQLGLPAAARAHHQELARWFEHRRGFFKVEWHRGPSGIEPLAAVYFRRRPPVAEVLARLGLTPAARDRARDLAAALEKDTIHFVAAAFRPDQPVHHKLYCSQWVTGETRAAVAARIGRVLELHGFGPGAHEAWIAQHERCLGPDDTTLFVSMSSSDAGLSPTFKIDYPALDPDTCAGWVPPDGRRAVADDVRRTMALAGAPRLTFLGVRFATDRPVPALKYYADVPGSR